MTRFKYTLRRFFLPREHDHEVALIRTYQNYVRDIRRELARYDKLMENGYIGDKMFEMRESLLYSESYYKSKIKELKEQWKRNH